MGFRLSIIRNFTGPSADHSQKLKSNNTFHLCLKAKNYFY